MNWNLRNRTWVELTLVVVCCAALFGCSQEDHLKKMHRIEGRTPFQGGYESLMTQTEVLKKLGVQDSQVDIRPKPGSEGREWQVLFAYKWFEIESQSLLPGHVGKIRFEFYHDKLGRMTFFPGDLGSFREKVLGLSRTGPSGYEYLKSNVPNLRIGLGPSHVVWMDGRIIDLVDSAN